MSNQLGRAKSANRLNPCGPVGALGVFETGGPGGGSPLVPLPFSTAAGVTLGDAAIRLAGHLVRRASAGQHGPRGRVVPRNCATPRELALSRGHHAHRQTSTKAVERVSLASSVGEVR